MFGFLTRACPLSGEPTIIIRLAGVVCGNIFLDRDNIKPVKEGYFILQSIWNCLFVGHWAENMEIKLHSIKPFELTIYINKEYNTHQYDQNNKGNWFLLIFQNLDLLSKPIFTSIFSNGHLFLITAASRGVRAFSP